MFDGSGHNIRIRVNHVGVDLLLVVTDNGYPAADQYLSLLHLVPTQTWATPWRTTMEVMTPGWDATMSQGVSSFSGIVDSTSFSLMWMSSLVPETRADTQVISGKLVRMEASRSSQLIPGLQHAVINVLGIQKTDQSIIGIPVIALKLDIPDKQGHDVKHQEKGHDSGTVIPALPVPVNKNGRPKRPVMCSLTCALRTRGFTRRYPSTVIKNS